MRSSYLSNGTYLYGIARTAPTRMSWFFVGNQLFVFIVEIIANSFILQCFSFDVKSILGTVDKLAVKHIWLFIEKSIITPHTDTIVKTLWIIHDHMAIA